MYIEASREKQLKTFARLWYDRISLTLKVTPTIFWLKCINLSKRTKFCSTDKLEVADKYFGLLAENYLRDWQIRGLKDGISGNIWVVYWNL